MKAVLIGFILILSSFTCLAAEQVKVEQALRCSTIVLNNPKTGELIVATTTCPGTDNAPGTVTKVFPDGKVTVLQNGQIVNL